MYILNIIDILVKCPPPFLLRVGRHSLFVQVVQERLYNFSLPQPTFVFQIKQKRKKYGTPIGIKVKSRVGLFYPVFFFTTDNRLVVNKKILHFSVRKKLERINDMLLKVP